MSTTTFSGPIRAGDIFNTSGTTLGQDVANVGQVVMVQSQNITQATNGTVAGLFTSNIVLPASSQILAIRLTITTAWTGPAATFNVGTSATATELAVAATATNTGAAIGVVNVLPGTDATRMGKWNDIGTADSRIFVLSTNTGTGAGVLTVEYVQANNLTA